MKILIVHNSYQIYGGEDSVVENESTMLADGHIVKKIILNNDDITTLFDKVRVFFGTTFSFRRYNEFLKVLSSFNPDVVHVHNYFPLISPSVFYACNKAKIPVVHTLHNFRAVCPTATLMYDNKIDERSLIGSPWWTVFKKVYRGSYLGTFVLSLMVYLHKKIKTWHLPHLYYIWLTEFARTKYQEAGWPVSKIFVKPNFLQSSICYDGGDKDHIKNNAYGVYVGRLSEEKGISHLLEAWNHDLSTSLTVIGDGPLSKLLVNSGNSLINYIGRQNKTQVLECVRKANFLVMASVWYEGFPMVIVESFACGTPVFCPRLGSMEEVVEDGVTGLLFDPGNSSDLAAKVKWMESNPAKVREMAKNARKVYESKYTDKINKNILIQIYNQIITNSRKKES